MKLSSITNKHPEGQWFEYAEGVEVFLVYGGSTAVESITGAAAAKMQELASEHDDIENLSDDELKTLEHEAQKAAMLVLADNYFLDFKGLEDEEGEPLENSQAVRAEIAMKADHLRNWIDDRICDFSYWT